MADLINELEAGLRKQLSTLVNEIRSAETSLISTKEGYLKVQGALEILDIIKKRVEITSDAVITEVALDQYARQFESRAS